VRIRIQTQKDELRRSSLLKYKKAAKKNRNYQIKNKRSQTPFRAYK